jgi:ribosomal protein S18 acetylase RimI-like enzyme
VSAAQVPPHGDKLTLTIEVVIRECRADDLQLLEWFGLFSAPPHRQAIAEVYRRHMVGETVFLVAEANRLPVGQVWIDLTTKRRNSIGVISALRVIPVLQGLGIGTRLIRAAEHLMEARGLTASEIGVEKDNPRAQRLYERLGYRIVGDNYEPDDERGGFWEWIMSKALL